LNKKGQLTATASPAGPAAASRNSTTGYGYGFLWRRRKLSTAGYGLWTLRRLTAAARGSTLKLLNMRSTHNRRVDVWRMHESIVFCSTCAMSSYRKFTFAISSPDEFLVVHLNVSLVSLPRTIVLNDWTDHY